MVSKIISLGATKYPK